jgi:hypothetical protein
MKRADESTGRLEAAPDSEQADNPNENGPGEAAPGHFFDLSEI